MSDLPSAPAGRDDRPSTAPDDKGDLMRHRVIFAVVTAVLDAALAVLVVRATPARFALGLSALLLVVGVLAWLGVKQRLGASSRGTAWGQLSWSITLAVVGIVNAIVVVPLSFFARSEPFGPLYAAWLVVVVVSLSLAIRPGRKAWRTLGLMPALPPSVTAADHFLAIVQLVFYGMVTMIAGGAGVVTTLGAAVSWVFDFVVLSVFAAIVVCVAVTFEADGGLLSRASVQARLACSATVGVAALAVGITMAWLVVDRSHAPYAGYWAVLAICAGVVLLGAAVRLGRQARLTLRRTRDDEVGPRTN